MAVVVAAAAVFVTRLLVDLVLAACDQSDDQTEICGLVDDFLQDGRPGRAIGERRALPAMLTRASRTCTRAA